MSERARRLLRWGCVALVLAATLWPQAPGRVEGLSRHCLVCGARGTADLLANVLLFLPLGAVWARPDGGRRAVALAVGAGALLSLAVETAQLSVLGRHATLADLVANTTGAGLGGVLAVTSASWLRPSGRTAGALSTAWGGVVAALALSTGTLFAPALPDAPYWGQHAPDLGQFHRFPGEVLEARVGAVRVPGGRLDPATRRRVAEALTEGPRVTVAARFGAPPPGLAPVLSVFDARQREVFVLGQDRDDAVFRLRRRADRMRLHSPDLRAGGLLADLGPGDTATVSVRPGRTGPGLCLRARERERCGVGHSVGRGWALLADVGAPPWLAGMMDASWIALLFLPLGFWARPGGAWRGGVLAALAGILAAPAAGPLLAAGAAEAGGAAAGLVAGALGRRALGPGRASGAP